MKNVFKNMLGIFIIMIVGFGIISNFLHFINIRKTEPINLRTNSEYKQVKAIINEIKDNLDKVTQGAYPEQEMTLLNEYINTCYDGLSTLSLFEYETKSSINDKEKMLLLSQINNTRCPSSMISYLNIISKYDEGVDKIKDVYASALLESMLNLELISRRLYNNYEYSSFIDVIGTTVKPSFYEINIMINSIRTKAIALRYVTSYLANDGGANNE